MSVRFKYLLVILSAILVIFASCKQAYSASNDENIVKSITQSYIFKTYLKSDDIRVASSKGAVTLNGSVSLTSEKILSLFLAESVYGVTQVNNELSVRSIPPLPDLDEVIAEKVRMVLLFNKNVNPENFKIYVQDSVVTLEGEVPDQLSSDSIEKYISGVTGVRDVYNNIEIAARYDKRQLEFNDIDDPSVTAQIRMIFLYNRLTGGLKIECETVNGQVTLRGTVEKLTDKVKVSDLIRDVKGVKGLSNYLSPKYAGSAAQKK